MIKIIDDIINKREQEYIKDTLLSRTFPWYYINDISILNNTEERKPGLSHYFVFDSQYSSDYNDIINNMVVLSLKHINKTEAQVFKSRAFLQFPLSNNLIKGKYIDSPHRDMKEKHLALLYYVNDSDGDTIIYENKKTLKIKKTIKPKQGRIVIFDGSYWHSGSQPKKNIRCIINTDIKK